MNAEIKARHPWWCGCKLPQHVDERLRGVWRFEGLDGALLRFRLWQVTAESTGHAVPTTETYAVGERLFWRDRPQCGQPLHKSCSCARPSGHPGECRCITLFIFDQVVAPFDGRAVRA